MGRRRPWLVTHTGGGQKDRQHMRCVAGGGEDHRRCHLIFAMEDGRSAAGRYACTVIQSSLATQATTSPSCGWAARRSQVSSGQVGQSTDLQDMDEKWRSVCSSESRKHKRAVVLQSSTHQDPQAHFRFQPFNDVALLSSTRCLTHQECATGKRSLARSSCMQGRRDNNRWHLVL